jgi:hypothetical protein
LVQLSEFKVCGGGEAKVFALQLDPFIVCRLLIATFDEKAAKFAERTFPQLQTAVRSQIDGFRSLSPSTPLPNVKDSSFNLASLQPPLLTIFVKEFHDIMFGRSSLSSSIFSREIPRLSGELVQCLQPYSLVNHLDSHQTHYA